MRSALKILDRLRKERITVAMSWKLYLYAVLRKKISKHVENGTDLMIVIKRGDTCKIVLPQTKFNNFNTKIPCFANEGNLHEVQRRDIILARGSNET